MTPFICWVIKTSEVSTTDFSCTSATPMQVCQCTSPGGQGQVWWHGLIANRYKVTSMKQIIKDCVQNYCNYIDFCKYLQWFCTKPSKYSIVTILNDIVQTGRANTIKHSPIFCS